MAKKNVDRRTKFKTDTLFLAKVVGRLLYETYAAASLPLTAAYAELMRLLPWLSQEYERVNGRPLPSERKLRPLLELNRRRRERREWHRKFLAFKVPASLIVAQRKVVTLKRATAMAEAVDEESVVMPHILYLFELYDINDTAMSEVVGYKTGQSHRGFHRKHQIKYEKRGKFLISNVYRYLIQVDGVSTHEMEKIEGEVFKAYREKGGVLLDGREYYRIELLEASAAIIDVLRRSGKSYTILNVNKWEPKVKPRLRVVT